jgi:hypothetical protein
MISLEIVEIGDGLGVVLPSEVLPIFKDAKEGTVFLTETSNVIRLTTVDPDAFPEDPST